MGRSHRAIGIAQKGEEKIGCGISRQGRDRRGALKDEGGEGTAEGQKQI